MRRWAYFILELCILLHLCCCQNYPECYTLAQTVYLLEPDNETKAINEVFMEYAYNSGLCVDNWSIIPITFEELLNSTLWISLEYNVVLYLNAKISESSYDYNTLLNSNFIPADNSREYNEYLNNDEPICKSNIPYSIGISSREVHYDVPKITKLVSKNIYIEERCDMLYEFILHFDVKKQENIDTIKTPRKPKVVVCSRSDIDLSLFGIERITTYEVKSTCEYEDLEGATAVLAPKPFDLLETLDNPVIFYDHLYLLDETVDIFPNSFTLIQPWNKLTYAVMEFMKQMNWHRAAIVSDDSPFSESFEQSLTSLFDKENVIHGSELCLGRHCNFNKALESLRKVAPRIVIANVGEEYAEKLMNEARKTRMVRGIVWLTRDWSVQVVKKAAKILNDGEVYSISLAPKFDEYTYIDRHMPDNDTKILMKRIFQPLTVIEKLLDYLIIDSIKKAKAAKYFNAMAIKTNLHDIGDIGAYVFRTNKAGQRKQVAEMTISRINTVTLNSLNIDPNVRNSELSGCIFKSNHYYKPCNDFEFLYLMLVICVFAITLLGIIYFFETPNHYSRMAP